MNLWDEELDADLAEPGEEAGVPGPQEAGQVTQDHKANNNMAWNVAER